MLIKFFLSFFLKSIESSNMDNLLQLNQAFILLQGNVIHLNELCHSYENRPPPIPRYQHNNSTSNHQENNRFNYNKVIDKAAEVASSVKSIINLYNIQTTAANIQ